MAYAINTRTGKSVSVPEHYLGHPVLGKDLVAFGDNVEAAPKKEKKKKFAEYVPQAQAALVQDETVEHYPVDTEIEEQPAPATNIKENEE